MKKTFNLYEIPLLKDKSKKILVSSILKDKLGVEKGHTSIYTKDKNGREVLVQVVVYNTEASITALESMPENKLNTRPYRRHNMFYNKVAAYLRTI